MELVELKFKIDEFQLDLEDAQGFDKSIILQDAIIFKSLVEIVDGIKTMVADVEKDGRWDSLNDILLLREIRKSYNELRGTIRSMSIWALRQIKDYKNGAWIEDKSIETYVNNNHAAGKAEFSKEYLEETNSSSLSAREKTFMAINNIVQLVMHELDQGRILLDKIGHDDADCMERVERSLRDYANDIYTRTLRNLKHEAQKYKPSKSAKMTPEIWGEVMKNEERILTLARDGELTRDEYINDEHFEGFTDDMRKQMEKSPDLMQKILTVSLDDSLFDLKHAAEKDLLSSLKIENLDIFHELILRHNIIRCETYPELKSKYEDWLNGKSDDEISEKLRPIFYGNIDESRAFLSKIKGLRNTGITKLVKELVKEKKISDVSYKRDLWRILNEAGLYTATESNWNQQV